MRPDEGNEVFLLSPPGDHERGKERKGPERKDGHWIISCRGTYGICKCHCGVTTGRLITFAIVHVHYPRKVRAAKAHLEREFGKFAAKLANARANGNVRKIIREAFTQKISCRRQELFCARCLETFRWQYTPKVRRGKYVYVSHELTIRLASYFLFRYLRTRRESLRYLRARVIYD